jgi:glycosyltransferase involved in cell wall biosynthesis
MVMRTEIALSTGRRRLLEVLYSFRVGGSEIVGIELAHQLAASGADVACTAVDGMSGPLRDRCRELGLKVVDLGIPGTSVFGRNGLSLGLTQRLRELNLDAIHLHHFVGLNKLGVAARLAGIRRIVVTEHADDQLRDSIAARLRLRLNWRLAHAITVIHEGLQQYLVDDLGVPPSRITVIPNGIDVSRWHRYDRTPRRHDLGVGDEFVFMYAGRVAEIKNIPGLIVAFRDAQARLPVPARLFIVGDGADTPTCRATIASSGCRDSVTLVGERPDIRPYLAAADAFVMNSRSEGRPRALVEAMAMGLPAVCPRVGGIPSMLEGRGWLFPANDQGELTQALIEVACDPVRAVAAGEKGRAFVTAAYDASDIVLKYQSLLFGGFPEQSRASKNHNLGDAGVSRSGTRPSTD